MSEINMTGEEHALYVARGIEAARLDRELRSERAKRRDLEAQLHEAMRQGDSLYRCLVDARDGVSDLVGENNELQRLAEAHTEVEKLSRRISELYDHGIEQQLRADEAEKKLEIMRANFERETAVNQGTITRLANTVDRLHAELEAEGDTLAQRQQLIGALSEEIGGLQETISMMEAEADGLRAQVQAEEVESGPRMTTFSLQTTGLTVETPWGETVRMRLYLDKKAVETLVTEPRVIGGDVEMRIDFDKESLKKLRDNADNILREMI